MLILTVEETNQQLRERRADIAANQANTAEHEQQVIAINDLAQAATGDERDRLDREYLTAVRRVERLKGDLPALNAALEEAEQRSFAARYLKVYREWLAVQDRQKALAAERGNLEAQIDDLKGCIEELDAGPIAETDTEARNLYRGLEGMAQTQPPATMADLNLAVRDILYQEEQSGKIPVKA